VESLSTGSRRLVHATRMKFYCDADLAVTVELRDLVNRDGMWENEYKVEEIVGHKFDEECAVVRHCNETKTRGTAR
jgi:hypothetical protein